MISPRHAAALALTALVACTPANHGPEPVNAAPRFDTAIQALDDGDYAAALSGLDWVADRCAGHALGDEAGILLAAAALDPRNPDRDPGRGADAAAGLLHSGMIRRQQPVVASLYLLARELGAGYVPVTESRGEAVPTPAAMESVAGVPAVTGCGAPRSLQNTAADTTLPMLPIEPVPARLRALRLEQGRLSAVADSLRRRVSIVEAELLEKENELERIRRTLKP